MCTMLAYTTVLCVGSALLASANSAAGLVFFMLSTQPRTIVMMGS